jgi:hypothetical protein
VEEEGAIVYGGGEKGGLDEKGWWTGGRSGMPVLYPMNDFLVS